MSIHNIFFENNRKELIEAVEDNIALVLYAGKPERMSADNDYRFLPDRNYYYLTGVEDEDTAVSIVKKDGKAEVSHFVPE